MTTDYNPIAGQYKQSKYQPWRTYVEIFTLMNLIGDPAGKTVVDLACGEGFYSRKVKQKGAAKVLGVDLSEGMIEMARDQETEQGLGIAYQVGDVRGLNLNAEHDLAIAAYLLNYARDREELAAMCEGIARCLRPGGRFVTVNSSTMLDYQTAPCYRHYGFETHAVGEFREGMPVTWTFFVEDGAFDIENYFLDASVHEEMLRSAGFREIRWHQPGLSPEGIAAHGRDYWTCFMEHPPIVAIECVK